MHRRIQAVSNWPEDPKKLGLVLSLGQVGMEMVVPIVAGLALDYYSEKTAPWGILAGVLLGFSGGLLHLVAIMKRLEKLHDKDPKPPEKP
jgi:F0F1-type ATP synthase assembly protein I